MSRLVALCLSGCFVMMMARSPSAQLSSSAQDPARFEAGTSAVLVDVVVRDDDGPVTDLTAADFEVFEDGVPQTIVTFQRHVPDSASSVSAPNVAMSGLPERMTAGPSVTAMAWGPLSPEGRALAAEAARAMVEERAANELIGVFLVDRSLQTIQPYTTEDEALEAAVHRVAATATTGTSPEPNTMLESRMPRPSTSPTAGAEQGAPPAASPNPKIFSGDPSLPSGAGPEAALRRVLQRMENSYQELLADMQGHAAMDALLALVDSLGEIPGRKTVVFLCEGLTVAPSVEATFRSIIETANRRNVSVYALDAAGLRVHSKQAETAREIGRLATAGITGIERPNDRKWTEDLERNEQVLKLDPSASLGILTGETGGLLIHNTNDLDDGIARINEDRRHHYLLTYTPTNSALDGTYRAIEVRVKRPGVEVAARRGYIAVPARGAGPVLGYEAPALAALAVSPTPNAFPVQAAALSVPMPGRPGLMAVLIGVDGQAVTYAEDADAGTYSGEATILARISDASGEAVRKQSQEYQLSGQLAELDRVRSGGLLFFRTPELPAGRYTLAAAVHDRGGDRAGVTRIDLEVPDGSLPVVGDFFVVSRTERLEADTPEAASHPLAAHGVLLYPSLGEPVDKTTQAELSFALPLLVDPAAPAPTATLELLQNGQSLAQLPLPIDAPGPDGRLMQVGRLPTAAIPAGTYDLRVSVTAGDRSAVRTTSITLVD